MTVLDTSAVVAVLAGESDADVLRAAMLSSDSLTMSAATYLELGVVVDRRKDPVLSRQVDQVLGTLGVFVVDFTAEDARVARRAYRDFGKGSGHPAGLNFGDCFAYALAVSAGEPLLFTGEDFVHTDVIPALDRGLGPAG